MIQAILDDRKSMTRRVIKPQPIWHPKKRFWGLNQIVKGQSFTWEEGLVPNAPIKYCSYGKIGDRLWVRETWTIDEDDQPVIFYKATDHKTCGQPWKSSIFMLRWASRITLEITDIRVERVQDINVYETLKEGFPFSFFNMGTEIQWFKDLWDSINAKPKPVKRKGIVIHYVSYPWDNIQEIKEYRGKKWYIRGNPFVWVIVFKMIK